MHKQIMNSMKIKKTINNDNIFNNREKCDVTLNYHGSKIFGNKRELRQ